MGDRTSGVNMIYRFGNKEPSISKSAFIAETACIIGDVSIGDESTLRNYRKLTEEYLKMKG